MVQLISLYNAFGSTKAIEDYSLFKKPKSKWTFMAPIIPIAFRRKHEHLTIKNFSNALADHLIVSNYRLTAGCDIYKEPDCDQSAFRLRTWFRAHVA